MSKGKSVMKYQAYCLHCAGGGKEVGQYTTKKQANTDATSHMNLFGCHVTIRIAQLCDYCIRMVPVRKPCGACPECCKKYQHNHKETK